MRSRLPILIAGGLLIGVCLGLLIVPGALDRLLPSASTIRSVGQATIGGPFTLTDQKGRRVTDADYRGKYMLVFFGFTFCPDVCPTALQVTTSALEKIGDKARRITPMFITVDPERDTPEALERYLSSFHPSFVGLTGTAGEIASVAKAYRVYYKKVKDEKSSAEYTMDHSAIVYLMGPDGNFVTHFTHTTSPDAMATALLRHVK